MKTLLAGLLWTLALHAVAAEAPGEQFAQVGPTGWPGNAAAKAAGRWC